MSLLIRLHSGGKVITVEALSFYRSHGESKLCAVCTHLPAMACAFCWAAFQPPSPKPVALQDVVVTQVQDMTLGSIESHTIVISWSIQLVQIPL